MNDIPSSEPRRLRTSDSEREEVATILRAAMAEGRLTLAEGEERLGTAYAATFRDEFAPLTADLPGTERQPLADPPRARAATRRDFRRHARVVAVLAVALTGLWLLSGAHFFWPAIPLLFLFTGLFRHGHHRHHGHYHGHPERIAPWNAPGRG